MEVRQTGTDLVLSKVALCCDTASSRLYASTDCATGDTRRDQAFSLRSRVAPCADRGVGGVFVQTTPTKKLHISFSICVIQFRLCLRRESWCPVVVRHNVFLCKVYCSSRSGVGRLGLHRSSLCPRTIFRFPVFFVSISRAVERLYLLCLMKENWNGSLLKWWWQKIFPDVLGNNNINLSENKYIFKRLMKMI